MSQCQTIPVLDLHAFHADERDRRQFVAELGHALEDIGFFALTNHGVDAELIQSAYQVAQQFFELPEVTKRQYEKPELHGQRGFTSFGREHAKDYPVPDLKEFWHVGRDLPDDQPPVQHYSQNLKIAEVSEFHPILATLYAQLEVCAIDLLRACALYLEQPKNLFVEMIQNSDTILRIIHYPPVPNDAYPSSLRSAPHEDINLITLLCEATTDGLELLQRDGTWLPVSAVPGQIIVDSGDMLQHLTNGVMKSTTHRVVNFNQGRDRRFSMPFFVHPRKEVDLSPLPACVAKSGQSAYPAITAGDYLMQRLQEIGLAN